MSDFIRDDDGASNVSSNAHLHQLIEREIARNPARRNFLKSGASLGLLGIFGSTLAACGGGSDAPAPAPQRDAPSRSASTTWERACRSGSGWGRVARGSPASKRSRCSRRAATRPKTTRPKTTKTTMTRVTGNRLPYSNLLLFLC